MGPDTPLTITRPKEPHFPRRNSHLQHAFCGHHPYTEIDRCLLRQTPNRAACNRAQESTPRASPACGVLESAWSPDAPKPPRGVHRSPRRLLLSLLFCAKLSVSDWYFLNGMEEVVSSNLTRSTKTFQTLTVSLPATQLRTGVQILSSRTGSPSLRVWARRASSCIRNTQRSVSRLQGIPGLRIDSSLWKLRDNHLVPVPAWSRWFRLPR